MTREPKPAPAPDPDAAIDEELRFHLAERARELEALGLSAAAAERKARDEFGDIEFTKRYCARMARARKVRAERRTVLVGLWQDVVLGFRQLRRRPAVSLLAILTLALGLGATTGLFSIVRTVILEPLPYKNPDQLVRIWGMNNGSRANVSPLDFLDWQEEIEGFSDIAAFNVRRHFVAGGDHVENIAGAQVSPSFLDVLQVQPMLGRNFVTTEAEPGGPPVVILSHAFWTTRLGGDSAVVGQTIELSWMPHTIVGVLPDSYRHPDPSQIERPPFLLPLRIDPERNGRGGHWLQSIGRLNRDVPLGTAQAEMRAMSRALAARYPETNTNWSAQLQPLHEAIVGSHRLGAFVLLGAVVAMLLIACVNVANLLLARGLARRGEFAVRSALGASKRRVVRLLLAESLTLAVIGGAAGLLVARLSLDAFLAFGPSRLPRAHDVTMDLTVLAVSLGLTLTTGVIFGLVPAFRISKNAQLLSRSEHRSSAAPAERRLQAGLVSLQIALATALLIGAGLMLKGFWRLTHVDPGFDAAGLLKARVFIPSGRVQEVQLLASMFRDLEDRLMSVPGVVAAGAVQASPFSGNQSCNSFALDDRPDFPLDRQPCIEERIVTPGYFRAMGIPRLAGDLIGTEHGISDQRVAVINESFAREYWPDANPIGTRFTWGNRSSADWRTITGVVGDVRHFGLADSAKPEVYIPHAQYPYARDMAFFVRAAVSPTSLIASVRAQAAAVGGGLPVYDIEFMESVVAGSVATDRFRSTLLAAFAISSLALAFVGIYGVAAHAVSARMREFGIRVAMGADAGNVRAMVLRWVLRLTAIGAALGLLIAAVSSSLIARLSYDVSARDPSIVIAASLVVLLAATLGGLVPAWRAGRVDPVNTLRDE